MQIDVTFRHMDSTPALKETVIEKMGHLSHFFDQVQDVHVVLSAEKKHHIAEVTVHCPGEIFKAHASTEDMYSTLDAVMSKLERHVKKRKEITKLGPKKSSHNSVSGQ